MNGKRVNLAVLLLMAGSFNVHAANNTGQIGFSGQIVESACEVGRQAQGDVESVSRRLKVSPALSLNVDTRANACRDERVPFSVSYQPLASASATQQMTAQGVVIITYN
ncbi:hypothetical protein [Pseudomonas sp. MWU13-2100]|uniref:hypothetical protein n=1 Tax=Pseudomonas sp. MWU13-2100 TaxID=2935075 RepID=UPI0020100D51|nr:hypothetical protein [Pseudomonas sp. MWU13-2100]